MKHIQRRQVSGSTYTTPHVITLRLVPCTSQVLVSVLVHTTVTSQAVQNASALSELAAGALSGGPGWRRAPGGGGYMGFVEQWDHRELGGFLGSEQLLGTECLEWY